MDNNARVLIYTLLFAIGFGILVVLHDKNYRPSKIAETNRGVFNNIPVEADGSRAAASDDNRGAPP